MSDCLLWTGRVSPWGYPIARYDWRARRVIYAHVDAWEQANEMKVPVGFEVDHLCRVRACVNPAHLEAVTGAENRRRANAAKPVRTHCKRGHPYTGHNVITKTFRGKTSRHCRTCYYAANEASLARRLARAYQPDGCGPDGRAA